MKFLERDLEGIIVGTDQVFLQERGLDLIDYELIFRQVNLGSYGVADIVTVSYKNYGKDEKFFDVRVFELKQNVINADTITQCARYMQGVKSFIATHIKNNKRQIKVTGVVIGSSFDANNNIEFLLQNIEGIDGFTYDYRYDGIYFTGIGGYYLRNEKFPVKDASKYRSLFRSLIQNMYICHV